MRTPFLVVDLPRISRWSRLLLALAPSLVPGAFSFDMDFRYSPLPAETGHLRESLSPADIDKDGDLDFFTGRYGSTAWYENLGGGQWQRHTLSDSTDTDVGAVALDVDGDGWVDRIAGSWWYRNPGAGGGLFTAYRYGYAYYAHDMKTGDIDGDGRSDVISIIAREIFWLKRPEDPLLGEPWERDTIVAGDEYATQHGGLSVGDIDGDGDLDVARLDCWFENPGDGKGIWTRHDGPDFGKPGPWGLTGRAMVIDMDGDGANDLLQAECDYGNGRVAWFRNLDGHGGSWETHLIKDSTDGQDFHSLVVADFDQDGDSDIFSMGGPNGSGMPKAYLWERLDSTGTLWKEHILLEGINGHEAAAGDFDGDGDMDILAKIFGDSVHFLLENQLIPSAPIRPGRKRQAALSPPPPRPWFMTPLGLVDPLGRPYRFPQPQPAGNRRR